MLLTALFISFPVSYTANFRFDGRHCIGDLMANTMVRKLLYSEGSLFGFLGFKSIFLSMARLKLLQNYIVW